MIPTLEEKPPMGLMPPGQWKMNRRADIYDAMLRYRQAGKQVPFEWVEELYELEKELR